MNFLADRHGKNHKHYQTGSSYPSTDNFVSYVALKKGEQAYYKTESYTYQHNMSPYTDCQTVDGVKHSCTWVEIHKSGDLIVTDPEL